MLTVEQHEAKARDFLAFRWFAADVHSQYPAPTAKVIELLTGLECVVDDAIIAD